MMRSAGLAVDRPAVHAVHCLVDDLSMLPCERESGRVTFRCICQNGYVVGLGELRSDLRPEDRAIVLDLGQITILRSGDLSLLVELQRHAKATQRSMELAAVGSDIRKIFTITRLDRLFTLSD